jgi:thymidylate synthase (FAD)
MKIAKMEIVLIDSMGTDLSIVNAARVSFHKESALSDGILQERDEKLISYLAKHGHWTPFGHAFLSFRIKAPIFVARQLGKHQVGLVWNEVSRRYVDEEPEFWFPEMFRGKPVNAKQGSSGLLEDDWAWLSSAKEHVKNLACFYDAAISAGMAPEQARAFLPQNTMTSWIWSGSLAAFARVCKLRLDSHAQEETRQVAQQINDLVPQELSHSWKALLN